MNILITGGTGFVGKRLVETLHQQKHHIYILTRSPESKINTERQTYIGYHVDPSELPIIEGVINLAGESLFGYWTTKKKNDILKSRIETTKGLLNIMEHMQTKPHVLINASAVGFYGTSEQKIFTEKTDEASDDFLGKVTHEWEETARNAETMGVRTVMTRFGVILGQDNGALPLMSLPIKLFVGGKVGTGDQWVSWIHIEDVVHLIIHCLEHEKISGPVNATAPDPKRNKDFMKMLADVHNRPYWFTTPAFFMRTALGEMSQLITKGQYVWPEKALRTEFQYSYPHLRMALKHLK